MKVKHRITSGAIILALLFPGAALAQAPGQFGSPINLMIVMGALAIAPFMLIMLTSFVKISVVLSIVRNAMGTQQIPPNQVITGLAFVLTIFVMIPVAKDVYNEAGISA